MAVYGTKRGSNSRKLPGKVHAHKPGHYRVPLCGVVTGRMTDPVFEPTPSCATCARIKKQLKL